MGSIGDFIIPVTFVLILMFGLYKKNQVFDDFLTGSKEGAQVAFSILPPLVGLLTAISMLKASGALDMVTSALAPLADFFNLPEETIPLAILRPISGNGALALFQNMIQSHGSDSFIGRVASVMMGSTETTFYTIAVYYGAVKISKTKYTLPAALTGDLVGYLASVMAVRLLMK